VSVHLTKLQRRLCNLLQEGLPICLKPFAQIATELECDEDTVLKQTSELKKTGVIRRITAIINHRTLGMSSTLVAAHIPENNIEEIIETVNALDGVSHNYLREHYYNLWFTLQAKSAQQIEKILLNLSARFQIDFHSLPAERIFKLDVRFDAESGGKSLLSCEGKILATENTEINLNKKEKAILSKLQHNLEIVSEPFPDALKAIQSLFDKGIIRRIAAVVDYHKLGFTANAMFACEVEDNRIAKVGRQLAASNNVSHCYQRKTFHGWPYNLFAMMHGKSMAEIQQTIDSFVEAGKIDAFELLPTAAELKKQPVKFQFY
jgi:DNA-binding Lrp family transcriptional regulator